MKRCMSSSGMLKFNVLRLHRKSFAKIRLDNLKLSWLKCDLINT